MANPTKVDVTSVVQGGVVPLGEILLAARKEKKLSQKDVSNHLRISIKQIEAIETNEFSALPESTITRGFIRNYARMLNIDAEPLLASYRARVPEDVVASLSVKPSVRNMSQRDMMTGRNHQSWLKYILGSILALLLLVLWFFYMDFIPKSNQTKVSTPPAKPLSLPEEALPAAERQGVVDNPADISVLPQPATLVNATPVVETPTLPAQVSVTQANTTLVMPAINPAPINAAVQKPAPVDLTTTSSSNPVTNGIEMKSDKVNMAFTAKTWVSIKNPSDKIVFEKTFEAGETGVFNGETPMLVIIGNAEAAQLQYLGQTVDLTASTIGNVARVKLE